MGPSGLALRVALALALLLLLAPAAHAISSKQAIGFVNAQRAALGIPAVKESRSMSQGCAAHVRYQRLNGGRLTHDEVRGRRGYSRAGDRAAGQSLLAIGNWGRVSPWELAPIHLSGLLNPRLSVSGAAHSRRHACLNTVAGRKRRPPRTPLVYTYPADGARGHRPQERAFEFPYTPGQQVGIRQGATTGPYLYVLPDGPWRTGTPARITGASLTDSGGRRIAVKTVDNRTRGLRQFFTFTGGMIIPPEPLALGETYAASVTLVVGGRRIQHDWTFTTG